MFSMFRMVDDFIAKSLSLDLAMIDLMIDGCTL